jgi:hypothetical protein
MNKVKHKLTATRHKKQNMDIKQDFKYHSDQIIQSIKQIHPELKDYEENIIRTQVRAMVASVILDIGNSVNALTNQIKS